MVNIIIKPFDVLFFRDGRPFDAGGDFISRLSFPPPPSTFYGALRTHILSEYENDFSSFTQKNIWKNEIGDIGNSAFENSFGTFSISDFSIIRINGSFLRLFPLPADIFKVKSGDEIHVIKPEFNENGKFILSKALKDYNLLTFKDKEKNLESPGNYFITENGLKLYLKNRHLTLSKSNFYHYSDIFEVENRTGIKIDKQTGTADEGFIYSSEFARMNDKFGFYLEVESKLLESVKVKTIKLGGESKTASLEFINVTINKPVLNTDSKNKYFKMILLTPSIFDSGWIPDFLNGEQKFKDGKFEIKLVSGILNRYTGIGGWDLYQKTSKPLRRAVPAGSVYYFEILNGTLKDIYDYFNYKSVHLLNPIKQYLAKQGFGITYIGEC